ncbi:hypothetical protein BTH42_10805 [Burkholderia sp. SRS-W-2-2016]|nr:hypothetical protein BTH42_10805 [Burkholderia sp. SRS-W-2-2016]
MNTLSLSRSPSLSFFTRIASARMGAFCNGPARSAAAGVAALALAGAAMLAASGPGHAQIPQGGGTNSHENRVSEMGSKPASSTPESHESLKPQSKDSGNGNARGKTAGQNQNPQGAGGFDNGLYGTGAGSNK